tara:strand:+ start:6025 stop:6624 length:600 start_codon:yes stop_codon:yes gene_type:complete
MRIIIRELFETVILAVLIFMALHMTVQNFRVQGPSMKPTLEIQDHVIVNKIVYTQIRPSTIWDLIPFINFDDKESIFPFHPPERGEVIIFRFPGDESRDFVKRVIGLSGDTVEMKRGQVYVNGVAISEPYLKNRGDASMSPVVVEEGTYFVMGDNRSASNDSRHWGKRTPVRAEHVVGRAWINFWPISRWQILSSHEYD